MEKFKNRYRIGTARLQSYDYGQAGAYYITIVTKNRKHYFGEIKNKLFHPSSLSNVVSDEWTKTPDIRPDMNIEIDEFIVMPNHFHAILLIGLNDYNYFPTAVNQFAPQSKNLASIIRGFKSAVSSYANKNNIVFGWHTRYHDHIIRDFDEMKRIREYIMSNPENWDEDEFFREK
jgi:REP element-mobilizing transposase RayT